MLRDDVTTCGDDRLKKQETPLPRGRAASCCLLAQFLFQLVSRRYQKGSIVLTSNKCYADWGDIFSDSVLASALLDRLLHQSVTVNIRGSSYWLKDKLRSAQTPEPVLQQKEA